MKFSGTVRYFRPQLKSGLAVMDIPEDVTGKLGGLKQMKITGEINGITFQSNTMPAGGRVLALSLSKKLLGAAGLDIGQKADVDIRRLEA